MTARGKTISVYTGALVITLFGAGATLLIVDAATSLSFSETGQYIDPFNPTSDFGY